MAQRILICDDEEGIRESLKLILSDHYDLIISQDGTQCLECLQNSNDIGLVLIDIKMPKRNGLEIIKEINEKYPKQKVIVITGYRSVDTAAEAIRLGACGYIVKPFKAEEILATVKSMFS